jgi:hypothetical protein
MPGRSDGTLELGASTGHTRLAAPTGLFVEAPRAVAPVGEEQTPVLHGAHHDEHLRQL